MGLNTHCRGQSETEKQRLLKEAAWLLDISNQSRWSYIEWFQKPLEELEEYSVISLKAWVQNARKMVRFHRLEVQKTIMDEENMDGDGLYFDLLEEMEDVIEADYR